MTTPTENPAAVLREAAEALRGVVVVFADVWDAVTHGLAKVLDQAWGYDADDHQAIERFVKVMNPSVAAYLAEWLENAAVDAEQIGPDPRAMRVARAILSTEGSRTDA